MLLYFYPTYVTSLCILYTRTRLYTRRHAHKHSYVYVVRRTRVCLNVSARRIYIYTILCICGGLYACVWTCMQYNAFTYILYHVYVCVLHDASRDISLRPKKGSRSHREIRIAALYALKDLLYCHLVPAQWTGRLLSDCLATFFPTKEEAARVVHERERRAGWESNRVSRSPIDWRYRPIFQIRKIA